MGVITSPTGAADSRYHYQPLNEDIQLRILLIFPALVQGEQAAPSIVSAIEQQPWPHHGIDVLIVGRGGGSIEELWAFNEEIVARAIFESTESPSFRLWDMKLILQLRTLLQT